MITGPDEGSIRLAFLLGRLKEGGAELQMINLAHGLIRRGFSVEFVCRSGDGPLDERARATGATVRHIGARLPQTAPPRMRYTSRLRKHSTWISTAREQRYDIVDAWLHPTDLFASLTRPLTGIAVVAAAKRDMLPRMRFGPATNSVYRLANRLTDIVVANAEVVAAEVVRKQGMPRAKVRVIRAGVALPPAFPEVERQAYRAAMGASERHLLVGCVGNFRTMKRHDLLLDVFASLLPSHPDLRLALVGDGYLREPIEEQIGRLGLESRVVLTGTATDLPPLYDAFDLYVQASNSEGLPNVLLEAAAARLPIVATAAGGTGEVVRDGETGMLVPIDDKARLAAALDKAISDPGLRHRLGIGARELIERDYGMDRMAQEYADMYRGLLEMRRGAST